MEEDGGTREVARATKELGGADGVGEAFGGTNGEIQVGGSEGGGTRGLKRRTSLMSKFLKIQ